MGGLDFVLKDARLSLKGEEMQFDPEGVYEPPGALGDVLDIDTAFVQAVATDDRSLLKSPYDDGLRSLAVTLAANRSAEEGGRLVRLEEILPEGG
jgi:hypothetical protein